MMKKVSGCFLLLIFCCSVALAQVVTLNGKVADAKTGQGIPGATIKMGNYGTSTNADGEFVLVAKKEVAVQFGINVTCIGYQQQQRPFKPDVPYNIQLIPATLQMAEVVIANSESIVHRAIRKIPQNYPDKSIIINGDIQMIHEARDSVAYQYFYHNNAQVKMYYPPYTDNSRPNVMLVHKKDTLAANPNSDLNVHWLAGYTDAVTRDYVHSRMDVLDIKSKDYQYTLNGKDWINGHRVFVVNFYGTKNKGNGGTLYIDTATYAFVRIAVTKYHVTHTIFIPIDKNTGITDYRQLGHKWYLDGVKEISITRHGKFDLNTVIDYQSTSIDTGGVKRLPYPSIIPEFSEDIKVSNPAKPSADGPGQMIITKADTGFTSIATPLVDTTGTQQKRKNVLTVIVNYMIDDNVRYILGINKLPLSLSGYQPVLSKSVSGISVYGFNINTQFRLYHELFFLFDGQFNSSIGGIKNYESDYDLTYNFILNNAGHPIMLSPMFGLSTIKLSKHKTDYYTQQSWLYGLNLTFELSPRIGYFINAKHYDAFYTHNTGLLLNNQQLGLATGFIFKLKL